ncbi:GlsB/YeaQ/YmgE family stress response membrane protein [soil metagenome]
MGLIAFIVLGALVGWVASKAMGHENGLFMDLVIGVVGSFIGSFVSRMFTGTDSSFLAFDWMGLFWSFIGAIILLAIVGALSGRRHHAA